MKMILKSIKEAEGDSKDIVKINADRLRKQIPQGDKDPRSYNSDINQKAEAGQGIFPKKIIDYIEQIPDNILPPKDKGRKIFIKWLSSEYLKWEKDGSSFTPRFEDIERISKMFRWSNIKPSGWFEKNPQYKKYFFDVNNLSYDDAYDNSYDFINNDIASVALSELDFTIPVKWKLPGGWGIVEISLETGGEEEIKQDLNAESCDAHMKHCAGERHVGPVLNGEEKIYSLRDSNNVPHVTLAYSVGGRQFDQCKGQANSEPKSEYIKMVYDWIVKNFPEKAYENLEYIGPYHKKVKQVALRENSIFKFDKRLKVYKV